tara:strand:+ start:162 stop:311 length:150 start_codon:yes stop_codon:yes gene_type:complete
MDSFQKKMSEKKLNYIEEKSEDYFCFEIKIGDLDIEKKMTEFTFRQVML